MRLAYLLKKFPRLSETFILNEVLAQEALGDPVPVYSRRPPDDEPRHPALAEHRGEVHELPSWRRIDPWSVLFRPGASSRSGDLFEALRDVAEDLSDLVGERLPGLISEALYLHDRTAADGVDHLHVHFATDSAITALILSRLGGPSFSLTAHAKDIYRSTVRPELLDRIVAGSAFTVTVCDANVEHMTGLVGAEAAGNLRRLYNGIDLAAFGDAPGREARDPLEVLAVGRLVEKKGFADLVAAAAVLARSGLSFGVDIVGEGPLQGALTDAIRGSGLERQVRLLGARPQHELVGMLAEASAVVLPCVVTSSGDRDGLPTVLLEAMAAGLPVVSTRVAGVPEIIEAGETGLLVDPGNPRQCQRRLKR